jgi:hypothetical protein
LVFQSGAVNPLILFENHLLKIWKKLSTLFLATEKEKLNFMCGSNVITSPVGSVLKEPKPLVILCLKTIIGKELWEW